MPPLAEPTYDRGNGLAAIKPIERLLAALETHGCRPKPAGEGTWQAHCPAHDDRSPSLSIREAEDGRVLLHDFGAVRARMSRRPSASPCVTSSPLTAAGLRRVLFRLAVGQSDTPERIPANRGSRSADRAAAANLTL